MSGGRAALECGLAGAAASLVLWAIDLALLGAPSFAGVSDREAQGRLLALTLPAVVSLEGRLWSSTWRPGSRSAVSRGVALGPGVRRRRRLALAGAATLALHALAVAGMMGRYPQLYADRWWLAGGLRATVQRTVTHVLGPRVFDSLLGIVLVLLAPPALARGGPSPAPPAEGTPRPRLDHRGSPRRRVGNAVPRAPSLGDGPPP